MDIEIIAAQDLARNARVVRRTDEMPYLVDSVEQQADGTILVTFSSGDEIPYEPTAAVIVCED
jgi:hypothetical protein